MVVAQAVDHGRPVRRPVDLLGQRRHARRERLHLLPAHLAQRPRPELEPLPDPQHGVVVLLAEDEASRGPLRQVPEVVDVLVIRRGGRRARLLQLGAADRIGDEPGQPLAHERRLGRRVGNGPLAHQFGVDQRRIEVLAPGLQGGGHLGQALHGRRDGGGLVAGAVHEQLEHAVLEVHRGRSAARRRSQRSPPADPDGPGAGPGRCAGRGSRPGRARSGHAVEPLQPARAPPPRVPLKPAAVRSGSSPSHSVRP